MLPQMMPLPWLLVFFLVFFGFFTVCFIISSGYLSSPKVEVKKVKKSFLSIPW